MKTAYIIIFVIITHLASFGAGWYFHTPKTVEKITIREVEKPVIKYIKEVKEDDCAELFKAYKSPINLAYTTFDSKIKVVGSDNYKETTALWEIQTTPNYKVYFGVAAVGLLAGGILVYKAVK